MEKHIQALEVNMAALSVITLVSHDPQTVAQAKRVATAYRAEIAHYKRSSEVRA